MRRHYRYRPSKLSAAMSVVVGVLFIIIGFTMVLPATLTSGLLPIALFGLVWTGFALVITVANARFLIRSFELVLPEVLRNLKNEKPSYTYEEELECVAKNYPSYPNLSLDYTILERCSDVYVMKCNFGWADLGTWHAIYEFMQKGDHANVIVDSKVLLDESHNNIIKLPKGRLGVISGLDGYIVAEEGNVLLICKKSDSSALVKKYASEVGMKYGEEYT